LSKLILSGSTSGSISLESPAVSGTTTLTLPTQSGTVLTNGTNTNFPAGSVLQVVNVDYGTQTTNNTGTLADTGLSATITPSKASSKILVIVNQASIYKATNDTSAHLALLRASTVLIYFGRFMSGTASAATNVTSAGSSYLDIPYTTSAVTYKTQFVSASSNATITVQFDNGGAAAKSTMTLMEIAA
jgi:hypothetical protein